VGGVLHTHLELRQPATAACTCTTQNGWECLRVCVCVYAAHTLVLQQTATCERTRAQYTHTHTHKHKHTNTQTHTHTRTCTHTRTHPTHHPVCPRGPGSVPLPGSPQASSLCSAPSHQTWALLTEADLTWTAPVPLPLLLLLLLPLLLLPLLLLPLLLLPLLIWSLLLAVVVAQLPPPMPPPLPACPCPPLASWPWLGPLRVHAHQCVHTSVCACMHTSVGRDFSNRWGTAPMPCPRPPVCANKAVDGTGCTFPMSAGSTLPQRVQRSCSATPASSAGGIIPRHIERCSIAPQR